MNYSWIIKTVNEVEHTTHNLKELLDIVRKERAVLHTDKSGKQSTLCIINNKLSNLNGRAAFDQACNEWYLRQELNNA